MTTSSTRRTQLIQGPPGPSNYPQLGFFLAPRASLLSPTIGSGNSSVATRVQFSKISTLAGIQFYWPGGHGALTIKASVWRGSDGARLAVGSVNVNSAGIYTANFPSPYTLLGTDLQGDLFVTLWETSGAWVPSVSSDTDRPAIPFRTGLYLTLCGDKWSATGDAKPNVSGATSYALMDLLISPQ